MTSSNQPDAAAEGLVPPAGSFASSVKWLASARWTAQLLSWATTVLVARLVSPDSYGVIGMSVVIVAFSRLLTDFGISTTVITQREVDGEIVRELHAISMIVGVAITGTVLAAAPLAVVFFQEPRLQGVLVLLSFSFLLTGATNVPVAWLQRHLRYRVISLIELARSAATSIITLIIAFRGGEYWALAIGNLGGTVVFAAAVLWVSPMRFRTPDLTRLRPILYHTHNFLFSSVAWFGYSNADAVVLGRISGASILGQYRFATTLASMPNEKLVSVLANVTLPVFGAMQADTRDLRQFFLDLTELIALVVFPLLIALAAVADTALPLVFGEKWIDAVPIVQIMCAVACLQNLQAVNGQVLRARGRSREARVLGVVALIVMPILCVVGARAAGGVGVAYAWVLAQPILFGYPFFILKKDIGLSVRAYGSRLIPGTAFALASGLAAFAAGMTIDKARVNPYASLGLQCGAVAIALLGCGALYRHRGIALYRTLVRR